MLNRLQTSTQADNMASMNNWFFIPQPKPHARLRLFCFPYGGGGSVIYYNWPSLFDASIEIAALRLPGRETRFNEKPFTRMPDLISALIPVILPLLDKPFAFYGHSMGARISFELSRQLRSQRLPQPLHLFLSGNRAPHIPESEPGVHLLPDQAFIEKMKEYEGIPAMILENPEILTFFLPMLRADIALIKTCPYSDEKPLACPITVFGGRQDPKVHQEEIAGWKSHTLSGFKIHMFPGGHFFLNDVLQEMVELISEDLKVHLKNPSM